MTSKIFIKGIFEKVENEGDNALKFYAEKFDNQVLDTIEVSQQEVEEAISLVDEELKIAINKAKNNIEKFHQSQKETPQQIETTEGVVCWRERVERLIKLACTFQVELHRFFLRF